MKLIALFALLAVAACASADDEPALKNPPAPHLPELHELFLGEFQETEGGKIESIGDFVTDDTMSLGTITSSLFGIPSCKLGPKIGNPICFGKCVSRGHSGGYCVGKTCTCV